MVCLSKGGQLQGELAKGSYTAQLAPMHSLQPSHPYSQQFTSCNGLLRRTIYENYPDYWKLWKGPWDVCKRECRLSHSKNGVGTRE